MVRLLQQALTDIASLTGVAILATKWTDSRDGITLLTSQTVATFILTIRTVAENAFCGNCPRV